jgi:translation elongation factor P/translation initiation factor 5A
MSATDPMVVQKAEYNKSGRNSAVVKMKLKNLLTGSGRKPSTRPTTSSKSSSSTARK